MSTGEYAAIALIFSGAFPVLLGLVFMFRRP